MGPKKISVQIITSAKIVSFSFFFSFSHISSPHHFKLSKLYKQAQKQVYTQAWGGTQGWKQCVFIRNWVKEIWLNSRVGLVSKAKNSLGLGEDSQRPGFAVDLLMCSSAVPAGIVHQQRMWGMRDWCRDLCELDEVSLSSAPRLGMGVVHEGDGWLPQTLW